MKSRLLAIGAGIILAAVPACSSNEASPADVAGDPDAGDDGATELGEGGAGADGADAAAEGASPVCSTPAASSGAYTVRFDQLGYLPEGSRWAVALSAGAGAPSYRVVDLANGNAQVAVGTAGPRVLDTTSLAGTPLTGDRIDLSAISGPGKYAVILADGSQFGPIVVDANAYAQVLPMLLRFLGAQRCGPTTTAVSQHAACHLFASVAGAHSGDGVAVDDGYTGDVQSGTGPAVDVEGGWHDAGDYIKFIGTTSFVLAVDLLALRDHAAAFKGPRLGGVFDALRNEMRWGLDWVLRMLGGSAIYHQVSGTNDHDANWRIPEADTATPISGYDQRPVFRFASGQGGNLLGRAAAALAVGSQVFSDDPAYASKLLALAKTVYTAGTGLTNPQSSDPPDFYQEDSVEDDLSLAAATLAQATGAATYLSDALTHARAIGAPSSPQDPLFWGDLSSLAYLETALAEPQGSAERQEMATDLAALAAPIVSNDATPAGPGAAFHYALGSFGDGSIEQSLGAAAICLASRKLGGSAACAEIARTQLHWLFGHNPFGLSFMIGAGPFCPVNIHHSLAQAAHLNLVGAILGGPTSMSVLQALKDSSVPLPTSASPFAKWSTNDLLYDDAVADYVVNEPAIDFTAPLVFVLGELLDP
jgi:hypothetical protein